MTLQERLQKIIDEQGISMSAVARSTGLSGSMLSQWMKGKYPGNVKKIEIAVAGFLDRQKERGKRKREIAFVPTETGKKIFEIARICHLEDEIGVVTGDSGLGKTHAVKEYARLNTDVILIEADLTYTSKVLISEIHAKLGYDGFGSIHSMFEDIIDKLEDSGRLIIIDEAENLPPRALDITRRINDRAHVGILLVGLPRLIQNLRGKRGEYTYLYNRVGVHYKVGRMTKEDVRMILEQELPDSNGLWSVFYQATGGVGRKLEKLIFRSRRMAKVNKTTVNEEIVRETAKMLIL